MIEGFWRKELYVLQRSFRSSIYAAHISGTAGHFLRRNPGKRALSTKNFQCAVARALCAEKTSNITQVTVADTISLHVYTCTSAWVSYIIAYFSCVEF